MDNSRKIAVVTGASSGIGKEAAFELARKGYAVVLAARRADRLAEVARQCEALGGAARVAVTDVAKQEQVEALVELAARDYGRIDVMINNAGYGLFARAHETTPQEFREIFETNVFGVYYGCRVVAPIMIRQGYGHIFNVASVIGKRGTPYHGAYSATKFAIVGFTDSLRVELKPYGVHVTTVCPALTETEFFDRKSGGAAKSTYIRFKKFMTAEAVAKKLVRTVGRSKPELVFTAGGKFLALLSAISPRIVDGMMGLYLKDMEKNMAKEGGGQ